MDFLDLLKLFWNGALTIILALLGWNWRMVSQRMDDIDMRHTASIAKTVETYSKALEATTSAHSRMQETLTQVQINYVHKDELREMRRELIDRFDRLEDLVTKEKMK